MLQEESDAQYKNKGKKGSKSESTSTATAEPSAATPQVDATQDVEMTEASAPSSSDDKKHVGEKTGGPSALRVILRISFNPHVFRPLCLAIAGHTAYNVNPHMFAYQIAHCSVTFKPECRFEM